MADKPSARTDWIGFESSGRHAGHGQDDYSSDVELSYYHHGMHRNEPTRQ